MLLVDTAERPVRLEQGDRSGVGQELPFTIGVTFRTCSAVHGELRRRTRPHDGGQLNRRPDAVRLMIQVRGTIAARPGRDAHCLAAALADVHDKALRLQCMVRPDCVGHDAGLRNAFAAQGPQAGPRKRRVYWRAVMLAQAARKKKAISPNGRESFYHGFRHRPLALARAVERSAVPGQPAGQT